jgi:hypothetical protein
MTDKELGEALLKLDLSPSAAPNAVQVDRIVGDDLRRIKRLTRLTVGLWIVAGLVTVAIFIGGGLVFPMIAKSLKEAGEGTLDKPDTPFLMLAKLTAMCMVFGSMSFTILVGAGLATVILVFRSRRATLRQINVNLLHISEQLKRVLPSGGPSAASQP